MLGSDGSGYDRLIHKTGAMRHSKPLSDYHEDENGTPLSSDHLFMDGKAIFDFTADVVPSMIEETLQKNQLTMKDVDLFVFHQALIPFTPVVSFSVFLMEPIFIRTSC